MKTLEFWGLRVREVAEKLIESAPAQTSYYGVRMRARFATSLVDDVVAQYERTVDALALAYGPNISAAQRYLLVCSTCGARDCKLWREYNAFADLTELYCAPCAIENQNKSGHVGADGKRVSDGVRVDQIGWLVPAVPTHEGRAFWGYTSVPEAGARWWRALPSYPRRRPS